MDPPSRVNDEGILTDFNSYARWVGRTDTNDPRFEFLKPRGMRIKTVRFRGQISQGICFPLSILPAGFDVQEDIDCTEALRITKYESPIPACLNGVAKGTFPSLLLIQSFS